MQGHLLDFYFTERAATDVRTLLLSHNIPATHARLRGHDNVYLFRVPKENLTEANQLLASTPVYGGMPVASLRRKKTSPRISGIKATFIVAIAIGLGLFMIVSSH